MVGKGFGSAGGALSRTGSAARCATQLLTTALFAVLAVTSPAVSSLAGVPFQLVYRVSHSVLGDLGSYVYTVEPLGNGATKVISQEHIDVRMFGIPVYREDASRTERWQGDRLVSFDGVTNKAGGRVEVRGEAQGDRFVITSPQGILTAAATVHPADPCAANFLDSTTIMRPDTGTLEAVRVSAGEPTSLGIDGAAVPVRKYVVEGKTRYTVWLNSHNLPVKFAVDDDAGQAIFTLAKCVSCNPLISQMGMR